MKDVLLLGSTGAVGRACLEVLTRLGGISLVLAGRDEARLREAVATTQPDVKTVPLDVTDAAAIAAAVAGSDLVINCAGPSQQFSADLAGAAITAGVPFVDPGGDQILLERLSDATVPVVLQTGVQPGLSGMLLSLLAQRCGPTDDATVWCGGLQQLTPAAVLEYVASLYDTHSHPGAVLRDGQIRRTNRAECTPAPAQYFPGEVSVHPHLDAETVAVAARCRIRNLSWLNVFDGARTIRAIQSLALDDRPPDRADLREVLAASKLDLFGRRPYFAIVGSAGSATVAFTCPDSYRVTGALTAFAAQQIADLPAGARAFWNIDEPRHALTFLTETVPGVEISFTGDSMIEEGTL